MSRTARLAWRSARVAPLAAALLMAACALPVARHSGDRVGAPEAGDGLVVLSLDGPDDAGIPRCVAGNLERARPELAAVPPRTFRSALFPWLEPSTAPRDLETFARLIARPAVSARLAELKVRYVAVVSGATTMGAYKGGILCGAGYGGGGCLGLTWAVRESRIATALWDVKRNVRAAFDAEGKATWVIPAFIIPIPLLAPTELPTCGAVTQQIADQLSGGTSAR